MFDERRVGNELWYSHKRDTGEDPHRCPPEYRKMQVIKFALIRTGVADLHTMEKIRRYQIVLWVMKMFHVCPVVFQIEPQGKTGLYRHAGVIYGFAGFYFQTVKHFVFNSFP
jgi:hypothetical protein